MAISGKQIINVGLQNESANSDSLYTAFNKINTNFNTIFSCASPYNTFYAGNGIGLTANSTSGVLTITNLGVTNLVAGSNIVISASNGNVTISSTGGGGNGGTVNSVGLVPISNTRITVTGSPIVSSGTFNIDLANSGVTSGTYTNPTVTVDPYGRITSIASSVVAGTVTSVAVTGGTGIQVTGSPITSNGTINVINTGVTRLSAGSGVSLSGSNGNVTISFSSQSGFVTSVGLSSTSLDITGSPITGSGTITVDLPANVSASRFISTVATGTAPLTVSSNTLVANLNADLLDGFTTSNSAVANTVVIRDLNANIVANNITGTLTTNAQPNITSIGNLTSLTVTGNITSNNIFSVIRPTAGTGANGIIFPNDPGGGSGDTASIQYYASSGEATVLELFVNNDSDDRIILNASGGTNVANTLRALADLTVTSNATIDGNLLIPTGNIVYTPRFGAFYSNLDQSNPVANAAMSMTFNNTVDANNVSVVSNSQLTVQKQGKYNIEFSAQVTKTTAGSDYIDIWLSKNGSSVAWTNKRMQVLGSDILQVASWNYVSNMNASDYVEIKWASADTNVKLSKVDAANTVANIDVPSAYVTITPVGA